MNEQNNLPPSAPANTHLKKIVHINLLLAICAVVAVALLYAWFKWGMHSSTASAKNSNTAAGVAQTTASAQVATPEDTAKLTQEYEDAVNTIITATDLANTAGAKTAIDKVSALHVPASLKAFQVQVLGALQSAQSGKADSAVTHMVQLHAQYSWFGK